MPRGPLWFFLCLPPMAIILSNVIIWLSGKIGDYGMNYLYSLLVGIVALVGGQIGFSNLVAKHSLGSSKLGLNLGYFFGEIMVCLALWFGSCFGLIYVTK